MARIEQTVFISYRRTDVYTALAVYENLKNQGYDVFFDYRSISSGDFEQIITSNIRARAHFILILTPTALDRCNEPGDWLRREIEIAIDEKRNLVPLFFKGFRFGDLSISEKLTDKLKNLSRYNGLNVHEDYFDEAMHRLRTQYLNIPLETVLHPLSTEVQKVVREEQVAADKALEQIEDVKELVKQVDEKIDQPKAKANVKRKKPVSSADIPIPSEEAVSRIRTVSKNEAAKQKRATRVKTQESPVSREVVETQPPSSSPDFRLLGGVAGGLLIIGFLIWGASKLLQNLPPATSEPTGTLPSDLMSASPQSTAITSQPEQTDTPSPTLVSTSPTLALSIGSTMISEKDGMTLLYVPTGDFLMGSDADDALAECQKFKSDCERSWFTSEEPQHTINLDAFWIDQTEVTNKMYALCVSAGVCKEPTDKSSFTHSSYYGNSAYDNYPVVYVDWNMAKTYCEWADRRLPTEAEWEKAARGTGGNIYPWGDTSPNSNLLNYYYSTVGDTTEVGKYPNGASPYGALDMAGNVWEWVEDWYDAYPGNTESNSAYSTQYRMLRGGAWYVEDYLVRSANRGEDKPTKTSSTNGFRCSRSP